MRFGEWLLTEMHWRSLPEPVVIKGRWVDSIDFRFEDWRRGANPKKSDVLYPAMDGTPYLLGASFSVPLHNRFLNVNNKPFRDWMKISRAEVDFTDRPRYQDRTLPPRWFNFAALYLGNREVKEPEWPREKAAFEPNKQNTPMWATSHGSARVRSV